MQEFDLDLYEEENNKEESVLEENIASNSEEGFEYTGEDANRVFDSSFDESNLNNLSDVDMFGPKEFDKSEVLGVKVSKLNSNEQRKLFDAGIRLVPNCTDPKVHFEKNMDMIISNHIKLGTQQDFHKSLDHIGYAAEFVIEHLNLNLDPEFVKGYCQKKADSRRVTAELGDKFFKALYPDMGVLNKVAEKINDSDDSVQHYKDFYAGGIRVQPSQSKDNHNNGMSKMDYAKAYASDALACYARLKEIHSSRGFLFKVFSCLKYINESNMIESMETELHNRFRFDENDLASITTKNTNQCVDNVNLFYLANKNSDQCYQEYLEMKNLPFARHEFLSSWIISQNDSYCQADGKPLPNVDEFGLKVATTIYQFKENYKDELNNKLSQEAQEAAIKRASLEVKEAEPEAVMNKNASGEQIQIETDTMDNIHENKENDVRMEDVIMAAAKESDEKGYFVNC